MPAPDSNNPFTVGIKWYNGIVQCCMGPQGPGATTANPNNFAFSPLTGVPVGGHSVVPSPGTCADGSDCHQYGGMYPTRPINCLLAGGPRVAPVFPFALDPSGGLDVNISIIGCDWNSGVPATIGNDNNGFSQQFGYFEMRAKLSATSGTFPAFWMFPLNPTANHGEIDIMEQTGQNPFQYCGNLIDHNTNTGFGPCKPNDGTNLTAAYHDYGLVWTNTNMYFMFDGAVFGQHAPLHPVMDGPYYLIFDHGVGGGWDTTQLINPTTMQIKYIRAYQGTPPPNGTGWDGADWTSTYIGGGAPPTGVQFGTYTGTNITVGYWIYLPPGYNSNCSTRYPVGYWTRGQSGNGDIDMPIMAPILQSMIVAGTVPPMIWVFTNLGSRLALYGCDTRLSGVSVV